MITRRQAIKTTALAATAAAVVPRALAQAAATPTGPFTLPALPYAFDALEPHIDARTMEIHHDRHHKAYVDNLNKALSDAPEYVTKSVEELVKNLNIIPEKIRTTVRNNGGGHYNHSLFWQMMKKGGGGEPKGELSKAIESVFGNFAAFKDAFAKAGLGQFGSGWAWLVVQSGKLAIQPTANQDNPITQGAQPLLGIDVWEHAYYLKYQNRRADYVAAFHKIIDWDVVSSRYNQFMK
jgi:Fe-Mn family superoxide dismutase